LTEMVKSGLISFFETKGREVILYWRGLDANAEVTVNLDVTAAVPGKYSGPASRAYLVTFYLSGNILNSILVLYR
jgi:hypothetical protein